MMGGIRQTLVIGKIRSEHPALIDKITRDLITFTI